MRVISGKLRGKEVKGYLIDGVRPTMDRVKESMFAIIQDDIEGSICLDLFAGSGNLGIEAISNGAEKCYFIDNNNKAIKIINKNLENLNIKDKAVVIEKDYMEALSYLKEKNIKFNIVLLDPPYDELVINDILKYLYKSRLLKRNAIIVCEYEKDNIQSEYYDIRKERKFNYRTVGIYTPKEYLE